MHIIVKKNASHAMFKPHYNSSMQKYYHTKDDYMGDIKKFGLEPYKEIERPKSKPLVMSSEGREMVRQASIYEKRHEKPGSRFREAYAKLGIAEVPKWLRDAKDMVNRGGFKQE